MIEFQVGDKVKMPGVPFVVEVLEIRDCGKDDCTRPGTFRFKDPETGENDWMHCDEFEKVG